MTFMILEDFLLYFRYILWYVNKVCNYERMWYVRGDIYGVRSGIWLKYLTDELDDDWLFLPVPFQRTWYIFVVAAELIDTVRNTLWLWLVFITTINNNGSAR